ncbi:MAG: hypothetical protein RMJ07_01050 [Nitrososphaerota archaeon]|nr:hypothetical protein [Candidatus Bathyarchaeota archaeon]MDW8048260.1 hypothetical protein [Nitrososphaerota archaeon]
MEKMRKTVSYDTDGQSLDRKGQDEDLIIYTELERLFTAAASVDALKIFYAAKDGISNSTRIITDLNLTPKKYYTNLRRLIEAGLVEKVNGVYKLTKFGEISFRHFEALKIAVTYKDRLKLIDGLNKANHIKLEELEEIVRIILRDANLIADERISDLAGPIRIADTWDKVVNDLVEYIDRANDTIHFASQYFDLKVIDAIARACDRNVTMYLMTSEKEILQKRLQMVLRAILISPKSLSSLISLLHSPNINIRYGELPHTLFIGDSKMVMVEVTHPYSNSFSLAFFFQSERLSRRLLQSFKAMWDRGCDIKPLVSHNLKVSVGHIPKEEDNLKS